MARSDLIPLIGTAVMLAFAAAPARAQQAAPPAAPVVHVQPKLVFEREVFQFPAASRRDPFKPLTDRDAIGPLFKDLSLRMVIFSKVPGKSVAVLADGAKKTYRLRKGESVGNATVLEIDPSSVVFSVEDFGNRRQEVMDMKTKKEGE